MIHIMEIGIIGMNLSCVLECIAQDTALDVALDICKGRLRVFDAVVFRLLRQEGNQPRVVLYALEDDVVGCRQLPCFFAGVVPCGDIARRGRAFIHDALLTEIEGGVYVGHTVEQHARLVCVGFVTRE